MPNIRAIIAGPPFTLNGHVGGGRPVIVTYAFPTRAELSDRPELVPASEALKQAMRRAVDTFEAVAGIKFVEVDPSEDEMIGVALTRRTDGVSWANYPLTSQADPDTSGRIAMNKSFDSFRLGSAGFEVLLHEIGHAVGLKHPFDGRPQLPERFDNTDQTIMSYNWSVPFKTHPRVLDRGALRELYAEASTMAGVVVRYEPGSNSIVVNGTSNDDELLAPNTRSNISGAEGHDLLVGREGNDTLDGGQGRDTLQGWHGDDKLNGGVGNDELDGGPGKDKLVGVIGDDTLSGGDGKDKLSGGIGRDSLDGGNGRDKLAGDLGSDTLLGRQGDDRAVGGDGNDVLRGGSGRDKLFGDAGRDLLLGGDDGDTLNGGQGDDTLDGGAGDDLLRGDGLGARDGSGDDELFGGAGNDTLLGDGGNDTLRGGRGDDELQSGIGEDLLRGGAGDDSFLIGSGLTTAKGDNGADIFVFNSASGDTRIGDFDVREGDRIDLESFSWTAAEALGRLTAEPGGSTSLDLGQSTVFLAGFDVGDATASMFLL